MSVELCGICKKNKLGDFFEKSICMYCGEPFCAKCTDVTDCHLCKRHLGERNDKYILKSLLKVEEKIKKKEIPNPERIADNLYVCIAGRYLN